MVKHGVTEFLSVFSDVGTTFFNLETDLLIVLDETGNISRVNAAFETTLGRSEADVLGQGIIRLVAMDDWDKFMHAFDVLQRSTKFRLLHSEQGLVTVSLIAYRFKRTDAGQRGFLVMRPVG